MTPETQEKLSKMLETVQDTEPMLKFFQFAHLPEKLREISSHFALLACEMVGSLPRNAERTVALRKLLESKDCAVRAAL